jgi:hypothetical protein
MELEDLIGIAAHILWIHVPQSARDRFFIILVRELLRENRIAAEKAGIGKEANLSRKVPYAVEEVMDMKRATSDERLIRSFHALPQEEQDKVLEHYTLEELAQ